MKEQEEPNLEEGVVVVAISPLRMVRYLQVLLCSLAVLPLSIPAEVLPEDRAEALYHRYEGGGVTVDGPSVLVRKSAGQNVSLYAQYYLDSVSSASVDVVASASAYSEERTEYTLGMDWLQPLSLLKLSYTQSDESDFSARSVHLDISEAFFGDLTTLNLGLSRAWDEVGKNGAPDFQQEVNRTHFRFSMSQILTKSWMLGVSYELISDEGYLNNPYRQVRYLVEEGSDYEYQPEIYPHTRTSNTWAMNAQYYLPWRAAAKADIRYFTDTWGIRAQGFQLGYSHPLGPYVMDLHYRYYQQGSADFFGDLFPYRDAQNFLARDKELSEFSSHSLGIGVTYSLNELGVNWLQGGSVSLLWDWIGFYYEDFRDLTQEGFLPGEEPLYEFSAQVSRLYMSLYF